MSRKKRTLRQLVREVEKRSLKGDERLIAIALLVREVRHRIEAGEAGPKVKWLEWAKENFRMKKTHLYELIHIAKASDPKLALDDYRLRQSERQKKRQETMSERDPERLAVIKLVRKIHIESVRRVRKHIAAMNDQ